MAEAKILVKKKTRFNHIYILQRGDIREMWFRGNGEYFLQSRVNITQPNSLIMIYSCLMMASLLIKPQPKRVLVIGLGGALFPKFLSSLYPETIIDVAEVDDKVIELSKKYFFFKETQRCRVYAQDGRVFVQERLGKTIYDMVLLDAFKSGSVPFHLKTLEFYEEISRLLNPGGVVASNLYGKSNNLKPHDWQTFAKIFKQVYLFEDPGEVATALIATNEDHRKSAQALVAAAEKLTVSGMDHLHMKDIATTYREDKLTSQLGFVFQDDFARGEFLQSVEKNNLNSSDPRPYAIMNVPPEEEA